MMRQRSSGRPALAMAASLVAVTLAAGGLLAAAAAPALTDGRCGGRRHHQRPGASARQAAREPADPNGHGSEVRGSQSRAAARPGTGGRRRGRRPGERVRQAAGAGRRRRRGPGAICRAVLDQRGCIYTPRVLGARVGQTLQIKNSDEVLHNLHSLSPKANAFNVSQPKAGMTYEVKLKDEDAMLRLKCDIHGWMTAYVGVVNHPYFAVSGANGEFEIRDVPAGSHADPGVARRIRGADADRPRHGRCDRDRRLQLHGQPKSRSPVSKSASFGNVPRRRRSTVRRAGRRVHAGPVATQASAITSAAAQLHQDAAPARQRRGRSQHVEHPGTQNIAQRAVARRPPARCQREV